jgi:hypothetical protein
MQRGDEMTTLEAAIAVPLILLMVLSLILAAPLGYTAVLATAKLSVEETQMDRTIRPEQLIRIGMAVTDSASILSAWIPGLGDLLVALGGSRDVG